MRHCPICRGQFADSQLACPADGSPTAPTPAPSDPLIGRMVGSYRVTKLLGRGGMGAVYAAEHPSIGSRVAVKFLYAQFAQDSGVATRFFNEAKAANIVRHDNIVQTVDYLYIDDTTPCLVMEYLDQGYLLTELARSPQPLSVVGPIVLQICDALAAAHDRGIIHRDLKPDNVYLTVRDRRRHFVKLMDFGIAKVASADRPDRGGTQTGTIIGTAGYMSPEQALGNVNDVGPASDLYSLGALMYRLAAGALPFEGAFATVVAAHVSKEPRPPSQLVSGIPPAYEKIILRCLAKRPADRFADARELGAAIQQVMATLSISTELPLARESSATVAESASGVAPSAASASRSAGTGRSASQDSRLITALRADHVRIIELLNSLKGRTNLDEDARRTLKEAHVTLLAHAKIEDEQLYPVLREHAEKDTRFRSVMSLLARDMDETTEHVMGFFDRCSALESGDADLFESELEVVSAILMARLWKEENALFSEYDKIKGKLDPVKLLEELQAGHVFFADLFEKARGCANAREARATLFAAREPLLAHIELEDREFHPLLRKHAESDTKLKRTLSLFAKDMEDVSAYALEFFERCAGDELSDEDLASECERVATILMARLWREENVLFPEYKKLAKLGRKRTLLDELRDDHRALAAALEALRAVDVTTPKGKDKALEVRRAIVEHLEKEDKAFYPILRRAADKDDLLRHTLEVFDKDLDAVSRDTLASFEQATVAGCRETDFAHAHGALTAILKVRMRREEEILFPKLPAQRA